MQDNKLQKFINNNILLDIKKLNRHFQNAKPFRYLIIDDFLVDSLVNKMITDFPHPKIDDMVNELGAPNLKHAVSDVKSIGGVYSEIDNLVASLDFKRLLEKISGIDDLIYDPSYYGGGTHNNLSGQGMDPHVDFNLLDIPPFGMLHRRIDAIIYLNKDWREEWGGNLDLHSNPWQPNCDEIIRIVPKMNRLVIFETNDVSFHGFLPVKSGIPNGLTRKSFAIYMYTKDRPKEEIYPRHGTFYVPRIPIEILKEGEPISSEVIAELLHARSHVLQMIKNLYNQEMKLNDYVNDRFYEIKLLKDEINSLKKTLDYK